MGDGSIKSVAGEDGNDPSVTTTCSFVTVAAQKVGFDRLFGIDC
jgi:hypothetical protein